VALQLKWHHQFQFAGYYMAQQLGYYREAGLEVEIREAEPGIDTVGEVVSGRAQFGVGTSALMLSRQRGLPVVVLAAVFQHSPLILMARTGTGITTVQDLAGKRLMIEKQADELLAYLKGEGVSLASMTLLNHTFEPTDLLKGKVDCISAYVTDEPYFLRQAHEQYVEFSPRMGGIDFYGDNLFTSEAELRARPAQVRAFRDASMRGWKYAMAHPEETSDRILARYKVPRGREYLLFEARAMVPLLQPGMVEMGYMYPGRWQHIGEVYANLGLLPKGFKLDGFLYDPDAVTRRDNQRLVVALSVVLALVLLFGGALLVFLRLNLRLRAEVATRIRAEEAILQEHAKKEALQVQLQQSQKLEGLGSLAGGVAHDMNNVLGAILGLASATLETQPPGSSAHQAFATIIKAAERGGRMVRSLLGFARKGLAEEAELDLNAILREDVTLLERTTLAKVRLELDLDPGLKPMRGDASALNHALMNLCLNAVDAMPGQGTLRLCTRNVDEDWIEVTVEDTGAGMTPEVLERALDPFFTTKPEGKGTGLGLSLVYSTVRAHQGQLDIRSQPGQGTCVRLRFPACDPAPAGAAEPLPPPAPGPAPRALRVMVVDDDDLIRTSMVAVLEVLGHSPCGEAACGEDALALLEGGLAPDLVIMDMNMPGLGGSGTLPRLRGLSPEVPVLLSTGRADQSALDLVEAYPHVTLLSKPFSMRELEAHLAALLPFARQVR
jgi:signal transduction histidine kinase